MYHVMPLAWACRGLSAPTPSSSFLLQSLSWLSLPTGVLLPSRQAEKTTSRLPHPIFQASSPACFSIGDDPAVTARRAFFSSSFSIFFLFFSVVLVFVLKEAFLPSTSLILLKQSGEERHGEGKGSGRLHEVPLG